MSSYDFLVACAEVHVRETVSTIKESLIGISSPTCLGLIMWTQEGKDIYNSYTIRTLLQDLLYRYVSSSLLLPSVTSSVVMLFMHLESSHPRTNLINLASRVLSLIGLHATPIVFVLGPFFSYPSKRLRLLLSQQSHFCSLNWPFLSVRHSSKPLLHTSTIVLFTFPLRWIGILASHNTPVKFST